MSTPLNFTTPPGRLVQGSLYKGNDKDNEGRPLLVKQGPNVGKPRTEWYFAVAIPKQRDAAGQIVHWATTEWGSKIWQAGHAFMPNASQLTAFAWKVRDGDSTVPNKVGKRPCDQEGFPGCWVVGFASGFPPNCYTLINTPNPVALPQPDAINLGDYIQVAGTVDGNGAQMQPGVFVGASMVCLVAYGERIYVGPDVTSAGFGGQPLPPGASLTPLAAPASALPAAPVMAAPPGMTQPPGVYVGAAPPPLAPPNPQILVPPGMTGAAPAPVAPQYTATTQYPAGGVPTPAVPMPPLPAMPAAPRARQMTAKAQGHTYEQMRAAGWTDEQLVAHGMLLP